MKSLHLIGFLLILFVYFVSGEDKYTDKYDNVNIDEILANKRLVKNYVDCFMDRGKCSRDGQELKDHILDALETRCAKCTQRQLRGIEKVMRHIINNEPEYWNELANKYDAQGKYRKQYEEEAKKRGIKI